MFFFGFRQRHSMTHLLYWVTKFFYCRPYCTRAGADVYLTSNADVAHLRELLNTSMDNDLLYVLCLCVLFTFFLWVMFA